MFRLYRSRFKWKTLCRYLNNQLSIKINKYIYISACWTYKTKRTFPDSDLSKGCELKNMKKRIYLSSLLESSGWVMAIIIKDGDLNDKVLIHVEAEVTGEACSINQLCQYLQHPSTFCSAIFKYLKGWMWLYPPPLCLSF